MLKHLAYIVDHDNEPREYVDRPREKARLTHEFKHFPSTNLVSIIQIDCHPYELSHNELVLGFSIFPPLLRFEEDDELGPFGLCKECEGCHDGLEVGQEWVRFDPEVAEVDSSEERGCRREALEEVVCRVTTE